MDLTNQVALVTGAASKRGIGREIARQLAKRGATVIISDIDDEMLEDAVKDVNQEKGSAYKLKLDVTDPKQAEKSVGKIVEEHGKIDILINNAGITRPTRVMDIEKAEWDLIFKVNVDGTFYLTQAVLPYMKKQNYGRIVNLGSVSGKRGGGVFGGSHYSAAKAAVAGFSKAVAREMSPYGITCNSVAPGLIATDITGDFLTSEKLKEMEEAIPAKRAGRPEDVAYTITFLASPGAGYITGEEVDINGGSHID